MRLGEVGLQLDAFPPGRERTRRIVLAQAYIGQPGIGLAEFGIELDGALQVAGGPQQCPRGLLVRMN